MNKVVEFLNANPVQYLATVGRDGKAKCRPFMFAGEQVAFDLFRFDENGKIAEHWDVMETIADQSTWQNQNGKF